MDVSNTLKGWRTVIISRLVALSGALVAAHDYLLPYIAGTDLTPITQKLPPWALPLIIIGLGLLFDFLRHITNTELGQKEKC